MQFKVPQFLEIEDKIFGPFTFRQFVYLAGGAAIAFVLYRALGLGVALIPALLVIGLALALAFYRPNNKPFIDMLESGFKYVFQSKLYVWRARRVTRAELAAKKREAPVPLLREAKLSGSKLRDLAWSLDVLDLQKSSKL